MRFIFFSLFFLLLIQFTTAQKKPLDHSVYDAWQSIGEKAISNDGNWVVYTIEPQEGDNELVIQSVLPGNTFKQTIPRGYRPMISEDSRYLIFKIKPFFKETRDAKIKKKLTADMPKDSMGIVELGKDSIWKSDRVMVYKTPEKGYGWVAYLQEKNIKTAKNKTSDSEAGKRIDSLSRVIDSLREIIAIKNSRTNDEAADLDFRIRNYKKDIMELGGSFADADEGDSSKTQTGAVADLRLRNLETGGEKLFKNVTEFQFSKNGRKILIEQGFDPKDSKTRPTVLLFDMQSQFADTLSRGGNEFKNFAMSVDGTQVAYVAERDAKPKDLQKYFKVMYFREGMDSAIVLADRHSVGMTLGMTISEFDSLEFSKSGKRLFFGVSPVQAPKDTSLVDIDLVKLDIWHYNDDYLQTVQLNRLQKDLKQSFLTVYDLENDKLEQLGSEEIPTIIKTKEGDGDIFAGITDYGQRIESQWVGSTKKDIYAIRVKDGTKKLIKKGLLGSMNSTYISPTGKYLMWYDSKEKDYFIYDGEVTNNITAKLDVPLFDEDYDSPGLPSPYGVMGWSEGDSSVYIYDRYDIWKVDPARLAQPRLMLSWKNNRKNKMAFRYIRHNKEENFLVYDQQLLFRTFNEKTKATNYSIASFNDHSNAQETLSPFYEEPYNHSRIIKAKDSNVFVYTKESFKESPDLFVNRGLKEKTKTRDGFIYTYDVTRLSNLNQQQKDFNWGTAELFKWKTFKGKNAEGILYKPEDFDSGKAYPLILYFYEKLSDSLYKYNPPSPTPSRLNISFFVSRGYLVFTPDIAYTIGHPAQSAFDYVVSAAKALARNKWVDEKNIGIQGQSWGGIQVAQLITKTDMFKAAWAGAPVANMTSAYGGIRWESGSNRQFQYEKTQSRIGATLWEKPELYIENSPLFHLPKVKTPLVIMANDADGAVPWYQGIELFTGLRRLGKKVWMLNYNGEAHNLVQRKNRKDIQMRQQQYFDWLLKGEKPARWIIHGVPAVKKGKDWGLEIVD